MTMVDGPTSLVLFHDATYAAEASAAPGGAGWPSLEHLWARERAERSAAKQAKSIAARRIHQELAQHYARQISLIRCRS
jgi:hypothetical protein